MEENNAAELKAFLPKEQKIIVMEKSKGDKINIVSKDCENGKIADYDPFKERKNTETPTSDNETLVHLLKASLGTGTLAMPIAFKYSGFTVGLLMTSLAGFMCAYCSYILIQSAHALYYKTRINRMSYAMVAEIAFNSGPKWGRKLGKPLRMFVEVSLMVTYFGAISVYNVIVASTYQKVIEYHTSSAADVRLYILCLLPILIALGFIPNLKTLAPFSIVANILMVIGIGVTYSYLIFDIKNPLSLRQVPEDILLIPNTLGITVFAMEAIGLVLQLENNMENPSHLTGLCGIHNRGMALVSLFYILIGMIGYLRFGDGVKGSITHNLDNSLIGLQIANISIATAVLLSYVLQYFVCLEIVWNAVEPFCSRNPKLYNYILRAVLVTGSVLLAVAVPSISPFVGIVGAFCFSILGILLPVTISIITFWDQYSAIKMLFKNFFVIIFGLVVLFFGTYNAVLDIISLYSTNNNNNEINTNYTSSLST